MDSSGKSDRQQINRLRFATYSIQIHYCLFLVLKMTQIFLHTTKDVGKIDWSGNGNGTYALLFSTVAQGMISLAEPWVNVAFLTWKLVHFQLGECLRSVLLIISERTKPFSYSVFDSINRQVSLEFDSGIGGEVNMLRDCKALAGLWRVDHKNLLKINLLAIQQS